MVFVIRLKYVIWPFNRALYVFVAEMKKTEWPRRTGKKSNAKNTKKKQKTPKTAKLVKVRRFLLHSSMHTMFSETRLNSEQTSNIHYILKKGHFFHLCIISVCVIWDSQSPVVWGIYYKLVLHIEKAIVENRALGKNFVIEVLYVLVDINIKHIPTWWLWVSCSLKNTLRVTLFRK